MVRAREPDRVLVLVDPDASEAVGERGDVAPRAATDVHGERVAARARDAIEQDAHDLASRDEPPVCLLDPCKQLEVLGPHARSRSTAGSEAGVARCARPCQRVESTRFICPPRSITDAMR